MREKTGGETYLNGKLIKNFKDLKGNVGYCPQFSYFIDSFTVKENMDLFGYTSPFSKEDKENIQNLLGLSEHLEKLSTHLSGRQKRKLSFYLAVITGAPLIILDEPTTGVDALSKKKIKEVLFSYCKESIVLLSSHLVEDLEGLSDRILFLSNGKIMGAGTKQDLLKQFNIEGILLTLTTHTSYPLSAALLSDVCKYMREVKNESGITLCESDIKLQSNLCF